MTLCRILLEVGQYVYHLTKAVSNRDRYPTWFIVSCRCGADTLLPSEGDLKTE